MRSASSWKLVLAGIVEPAIRISTTLLPIVVLGGAFAAPARAQSAEDFYKTHTALTLGAPADVGGTYDTYTRLLARYLPKYVPGNPSIVVQNIAAAGGLVLANRAYNSAPKDGTYLAMVRGSTIQEHVNGRPAALFDGRKFAWIGNMNMDYESCIVMQDSPIRSLSDLYSRELIVGASGVGAQSYSFPLVYNALLHMKFKVIAGYKSTPDRYLAMERGELTGNCGINTSAIQATLFKQYQEGKIRVLLQAAIHKDQRFSQVPNILDEAKTAEDRQALEYLFATLELGRPFAISGETPKDRVALLRRAFGQAMKDPGLVEEATKLQLDINSMDGDASAASVERLYATPRAVIDRVGAILNVNP
jgi:tripartite-type tricarboxylate transporter receptor subunit TctC